MNLGKLLDETRPVSFGQRTRDLFAMRRDQDEPTLNDDMV